jgi:NAD(P)-dependent dehydrogenase (short-subunit alcohol dehydrogenase family)
LSINASVDTLNKHGVVRQRNPDGRWFMVVVPPVVITGAAGGIGAHIARRIVATGGRVALVDRAVDGLAKLGDELGPDAGAFPCNLTEHADVVRTADAIRQRLGPPRALVSAAGWLRRGSFAELPLKEQLGVIDVNFIGALSITHALLPDLLSGHVHPRIVFIGSDSARAGVRDSAVYAAAKAAVAGFARSLALEVARQGLTVNVVSAGSVDAPMLTGTYTAAEIEKRARANPSGRLGTPADIAAAVEYFLSAESSYVTGQTLSVNGGMFRAG